MKSPVEIILSAKEGVVGAHFRTETTKGVVTKDYTWYHVSDNGGAKSVLTCLGLAIAQLRKTDKPVIVYSPNRWVRQLLEGEKQSKRHASFVRELHKMLENRGTYLYGVRKVTGTPTSLKKALHAKQGCEEQTNLF